MRAGAVRHMLMDAVDQCGRINGSRLCWRWGLHGGRCSDDGASYIVCLWNGIFERLNRSVSIIFRQSFHGDLYASILLLCYSPLASFPGSSVGKDGQFSELPVVLHVMFVEVRRSFLVLVGV